MNAEERKAYNAKYYSATKERIMADLCTKVVCPYCNRSIIKNNLLKHEKSAICQRSRIRILEIDKFNKLKSLIDQESE